MKASSIWTSAIQTGLVVLLLAPPLVRAQERPKPGASAVADRDTALHMAQERDEVQARCRAWVEQQSPDHLEAWDQLAAGHTEAESPPLLLVIQTVCLLDESTQQFVSQLVQAPQFRLLSLLEANVLNIEEEWVQANAQLWLGTELSQRQLYEESLEILAPLEPTLLVDPGMYFFHRAVCEHHLLQQEAAQASLTRLLQETHPVPVRYRMLGELMQQDLAKLEEKSLDEISRKMRDVERRLELGRSGQKVQKLEKEIIDSLDELIAKLEEQSGGGGGGGSGQSQGNNPNAPAQESRVKGSTAPGNVDEKDLGRKDGWGDLPPKEKAEAKQILGTMFPPHYQRAIEAYNRKAAQRERTP